MARVSRQPAADEKLIEAQRFEIELTNSLIDRLYTRLLYRMKQESTLVLYMYGAIAGVLGLLATSGKVVETADWLVQNPLWLLVLALAFAWFPASAVVAAVDQSKSLLYLREAMGRLVALVEQHRDATGLRAPDASEPRLPGMPRNRRSIVYARGDRPIVPLILALSSIRSSVLAGPSVVLLGLHLWFEWSTPPAVWDAVAIAVLVVEVSLYVVVAALTILLVFGLAILSQTRNRVTPGFDLSAPIDFD